MRAQVIVLAGPSGAGKSRLAQRLGLPLLRLDDFYKDGDDPTLPHITTGPNAGLVDWDHPDSWLRDDALKALAALCETGVAQVPVYDIAHDGRTGWQTLDLGAHRHFVAEGIFAQEVVAACAAEGHLAAAYCITQQPVVTFWRRLTRDLRERRKPPLVLLRRGLALMRQQPRVVLDAVGKGCTVATGDEAYAAIRRLLAAGRADRADRADRPPALPWGPALRQPDQVSCGPTSLVVARMLRDPDDAAEVLPRFGETVLALHRTISRPLSPAGRLQRPWPRRLGTAYWSIAAQLGDIERCRYVLRLAYASPGRTFDRLHRAASDGRLAALYVGTPRLPRHIVLVIGADGSSLRVFDPADGQVHTVSRADFAARRVGLGGWRWPWTVVVPASGGSA